MLGGVDVVVGERAATGAGEDGPLEEAVVGEGIVEDEVSRADDMADDGLVGGMAADEGDRVVGADEPGDRLLELLVDDLLARHQPARRHARAVAIQRCLRGCRHLRLPRHAEVVVGRPADHFPAGDLCPIVGEPLVDAEIRILEAGIPDELEVLLESPDLGELSDVPGLAGDLVGHRGDGRVLGAGPSRRSRSEPAGGREIRRGHVVEDRLHHFSAGLDLGEHLLGEASPVGLLQTGDDLHPLQRVEPELDDVAVEGKVSGPLLGDAPDLTKHRLDDRLGKIALRSARTGRLPHRSVPGEARSLRAGPRGRGRRPRGFGDRRAGDAGLEPADLLLHHFERPVEELPLAGMPLDLAARRLRDAVGADEDDSLEGDFVLDGELAADLVERLRHLLAVAFAPLQFGDDDDALAPLDVDREGRHRPGADHRAGRLDGLLDVLRIMVAAPDDDQILEPASDEQLAVVEEPEVTGAEVGAGVGLPGLERLPLRTGIWPGEHGAERRLRLVAAVPVPLGHARPAHPNLADHSRRQGFVRVWVDDPNILTV